MSKEIVSSSGVPQGSNIGPLLFILFINDVTLALPPDSISLFADDAKIFEPIHNTGDCTLLQDCIEIFCSWCKRNGLTICIEKCYYVSFSPCRSPVTGTLVDIKIESAFTIILKIIFTL